MRDTIAAATAAATMGATDMKKILVCLLAVLLLSGCAKYEIIEHTTPPEPTTTASQPMDAPDFTVYDIDGNPVKLSQFEGKPVVLNFWASWCGPCKSEMPEFHEAYLELGQDIHFLFVNLTDGETETLETASSYIASQGYTFPVYYDTAMEAANTYYVGSIPMTYFINAEGKLIAQATGAIDRETLDRGIGMITE